LRPDSVQRAQASRRLDVANHTNDHHWWLQSETESTNNEKKEK
jgi:hypothetical protein